MQQKIRILYFVDRLKYGGIQAFLESILNRFDFNRFQVDFVLYDDGITYTLEEDLKRLGCAIYKVPKPSFGQIIHSLMKTARFFRSHHNYDIIHSHGSSKGGIMLWFAKQYNIRIRISHSHNTKFQSKNLLDKVCGAIMKLPNCWLATDYFACSAIAWDWLFKHWYAKKLAKHIIKPCVDASALCFNPKTRETVRRELNLGEGYVIGNISRFVHQKNHSFILEVFKAFLSIYPSATLLLVGEGELLEPTRKKAELMGISAHVVFTGFRTDVSRLLQAIDLFLMPSINEGLPLVLVEAQGAGTACLLSDTITQECKILDDTAFLSLNSPAEVWANKASEILLRHIKQNTSARIAEEGFDVVETVKWLCGYYEKRVCLEQSRVGMEV